MIALVALLVVVGCGGDDSSGESSGTGTTATASEEESSAASEAPESSSDGKTKPTVTVPKGVSPKNFAIRDLEKGSGPEAKSGDTVTVQYVGVGYDSEEEFDSSWGREPFSFTIGGGEVITGWERGVEGMKVGGRRELLIPGKLAYGAAGSPPNIGPDETLIFVIDLLAVE